VANWIYNIFIYFKPKVIEEIQNAKSKILILFNGWGLKREKLSVVGVIVYFINDKYEAILRLIGLLKLLGHGKSSVGELFFYYY
jgi:hypothetical protein